MDMPVALLRRLLWRRRIAAARIWQEAERRAAADHDEAVRRILDTGRARRGHPERFSR